MALRFIISSLSNLLSFITNHLSTLRIYAEFTIFVEEKIDAVLKIYYEFLGLFGELDEFDENGWTKLNYCIKNNNLRFVRCLLKAEADVGRRNIDSDGDFPLLLAVRSNNEAIFNLVLSYNPYIGLRNRHNRTAMHEACSMNNEKFMRILIQKGHTFNSNDISQYIRLLKPKIELYDVCLDLLVKECCKNDPDGTEKITPGDDKTEGLILKYLSEITTMRTIEFYGNYTYYCLLKNNISQQTLTLLYHNEEFFNVFRKNLPQFVHYSNDLYKNFFLSGESGEERTIVYLKLKTFFSDIFPEDVIFMLARQLNNDDLPLL